MKNCRQFNFYDNQLSVLASLPLNASRVNSHGQFIFGKQTLRLFRGNTAFQQNRRCSFSHFLDMVKIGLFFPFFTKSILLTVKIAS